MAVVVLAFIFAVIFLLRLGGPVGSAIQFKAQNGVNLLVSSILSMVVLGLFLSRSDSVLSIRSTGPYVVSGLTAGVTSYLLAMFHLSPEANWLCLVAGFFALSYMTLLSVTRRTAGAYLFVAGIWTVMVIAAATGLGIVPSQGFLGLLVLVALVGAFVGVLGLFQVLDISRSTFDRFGYSATSFALLMVWLATSRAVAAGTVSSYSSLDWAMASSGALSGLLGTSVLAQRKVVGARIRKALADGHEAYQEGEYDEAIKDYDEVLTIRPSSKIARTCKADALAQLKRYDDAIKIYNKVLTEDKEYIPAISGKGSTLRQKGELGKSVIYLQRALNIDPGSKIAWNNKGNAFFFLDQLRTAIYCYKKAIELDPTYSGAWYNLAVAYTNTDNFLEADYAFRTATNLLEGLRSREDRLLSKTSATGAKATGKAVLGDMLEDRPRGVGIELIMGDTEKRVLSHIAYNPGSTLTDLTEAMTMGEGEARAILARLVKTGTVEAKVDGTRRRFYPKEQLPVMIEVQEMEEGTVKERRVRYLTDFQRRLVEEIEASPGLTAKELAVRMKVGRQVLDFHLGTLTHGEVLRAKNTGASRRYYVA